MDRGGYRSAEAPLFLSKGKNMANVKKKFDKQGKCNT